MRRSFFILATYLIATFSLSAQDKIYIWSEIEPGWKTRSIDYWSDVKGYGKSVPLEMSNLITEYFALVENKLDLRLKEQFLNAELAATPVLISNPGEETLGDKDLYLDLQCMILEATDVYPNYRSRKLNIEPVIKYKIVLYNSRGEIVGSKEILDKIDYKTMIRPLLRGMSEHRRDIEIIKESFLLSLSGPVVNNLIAELSEIITPQKRQEIKSDPQKFKQHVELLFDNRRLLLPNEYEDIYFSTSQASDIKNEQIVTPRNTNPGPVLSDELSALIGSGHYFALLIGINEYSDQSVTDLNEPINDAQKLYKILVDDYIFDKEHCIFLSNPGRDQIIETLDNLARIITENDNLLIFYAGHGLWDQQLKKGFWLPSDAQANNRSNWFSNSDLRDYIGGINSKHTLLISDACFSGGIFKTREAFTNNHKATFELYRLPSRKAMTSGNMSMVPDKSVFIDYLVKRLRENTNYSLSSEQLYASFKIAVINNSATNQVPRYGEIRESGDEGGDFLFIRRKK